MLSALHDDGDDRYDVVAAYSNNPTQHHIDQLRELGCPVIVMPDRDGEPGTVLCDVVGDNLYHSNEVMIANVPPGKDPADCEVSEIISAIRGRDNWIAHVTRNQIMTGKRYSMTI